ncbi:MAG: STAS domain-containing protein [Chitinivibrionales bacterium]|nr:STAS domain-containing protein [Chitinivibrionales bacterium]MBD3394501.1 STAS domain-containing protein [Chitinivibrionales bacterium]
MGIAESISVEQRRGFVWVVLPEAITVDNYRMIESKIVGRLSGAADKVVLDFGKTENVYSSGIGLIVRLKQQVVDAGGSLSLVNVSKKLRDLFEGMRLDKVLDIYATDVEFEISQEDAWSDTMSSGAEGFSFEAEVRDGVYRLSLAGSMDALHDLSGVSEFKPTGSVSCYVLDLGGLVVMDTYGSQLFLEVVQRIGKQGGKCVTYGANEMIRELLKLLSIERFVSHFDTEKEALASIKS